MYYHNFTASVVHLLFRRDGGRRRKFNPNNDQCGFRSLSLCPSLSLCLPLPPPSPPGAAELKPSAAPCCSNCEGALSWGVSVVALEAAGWKVLKAGPGSPKVLEEQGGNHIMRRIKDLKVRTETSVEVQVIAKGNGRWDGQNGQFRDIHQ